MDGVICGCQITMVIMFSVVRGDRRDGVAADVPVAAGRAEGTGVNERVAEET